MDHLSHRAVQTALFLARSLGLKCGNHPQVLADGSNVLVHLLPAPVVARVATTTALVRRHAHWWLALDLDIARYLAARQFPVVAPTDELPAGPHVHEGFTLTFWQYVEHDRGYVPSAQEVAPLLCALHAALHSYPGALRHLSPFAEIPQWLDAMETSGLESGPALTPADTAMLRRGFALVSAEIDALALPEQPLHGDAHKHNVLKTSRGLLWTDFEDACCGSLAWDLACFLRTSGEAPQAALAGYGHSLDPAALQPFLAARDLQGAVWGALLATRFPDRREKAAQWLALTRARYSHL